MATRNLTSKFVQLRNAAKANRHLGVKGDEHHDESGLLKVLFYTFSIVLFFLFSMDLIDKRTDY
jgi:hypothetical protein